MDNALIPLTPLELAGAPAVPPGDVLLWRDDDGLLIFGAARDRKRLLDTLGATTSAAGVAGSAAALTSSGGDYYKLTVDSAAKLAALGNRLTRTIRCMATSGRETGSRAT